MGVHAAHSGGGNRDSLALVYALPRDGAGEKVKLDWIGFLSLSTAVAGLQYVLARGHRLDWFESNEIILASLIAALSFYVFLSHSLTAKQPFLNLGLLRNRNLALGYVLVSDLRHAQLHSHGADADVVAPIR